MSNAVQFEMLASGILDSDGTLLENGKVYIYDAGTTNPKTTWEDSGKGTPHANPVVLSAIGNELVFGDGNHRLIIKDQNDVEVYDWDNIFVGRADESTINRTVTTVSATGYNVSSEDDMVRVDTTSENITINLPTAAGTGKEYVLSKVSADSHEVTLDPNGSETIGGFSTYKLYWPGETLTIRSNGTNWEIIAKKYKENMDVGNRDQSDLIRFMNGLTSWPSNTSLPNNAPSIFTTDSGGSYPFDSVGHLVINPRRNNGAGSNRDVVIAGGSTDQILAKFMAQDDDFKVHFPVKIGVNAPASPLGLDAMCRIVNDDTSDHCAIFRHVAGAGASTDLVRFETSDGTAQARFDEQGFLIIAVTGAPADSALSTSELAIWFDDTPGAAKFMAKAKDSNGTVVTGSFNLT